MVLLYGLGNHDSKYLNTKHNIGRHILEKTAAKFPVSFKQEKSYFFGKNDFSSVDVYWLYSSGYMNSSGVPLKQFLAYHKLEFTESDLLVILHDDSDQREGTRKCVKNGGSGGHHGINSIYSEILSTSLTRDQIWRLKIGIRPPQNTLRSETFVLQPLSELDQQTVVTLSDLFAMVLPELALGNIEKSQMILNSV